MFQHTFYFPATAIISLLYLMENGSSAEMGVAGKEGLVGVALFMGGETAPNRAVVRSAGAALRMKTKVLRGEFARGGAKNGKRAKRRGSYDFPAAFFLPSKTSRPNCPGIDAALQAGWSSSRL